MSEFSSLIHELEDAIAHGGAAKRQRALTLVTDLFVAGSCRYSSEQVAVFDDVIVTLAAAIETKARARLSRRLATLRNAPVKVVRSLAFDDAAEVAAPVLRQSDQLSEADLIANARSKSQGHLHAIAQRETLSADVTDILVARGDRRVVHAVSKNHGAAFSDSGFGALVERARGDDLLAGYIGMRRDVPRPHFLRLLESASASVRARLAAAHPGLVEEVRDAVADVASDISLQVRNASRMSAPRHGSSGCATPASSAKAICMPSPAPRILSIPRWRCPRLGAFPSISWNALCSIRAPIWCSSSPRPRAAAGPPPRRCCA
jgi:hypothetical protein